MSNKTPTEARLSQSNPRSCAPSIPLNDELEELDILVTFLQADNEKKSSLIARKLHDDLGGSIIGAMMDVAWIEQHDPALTSDTSIRLARVKEGLRGAIDLTRKLVEELRPTLLDSIGLFAALSWQFKHGCAHAGVSYSESYPASTPDMDPNSLITLFRIAQESFNVAIQRKAVSAINLTVSAPQDTLTLQLKDNGNRSSPDEMTSGPILSILHRVKNLKGNVIMTSPDEGGSMLQITVPLA